MKMYFGGVDRPVFISDLTAAGATHIMLSFAYPPYPALWERIKAAGFKVMLDSGAFTMWRRGKEIKLIDYCQYIKKHKVDEYIVLDDPEQPQKTILNQLLMEQMGFNPIPVFSYGAPWYCLDYLAANYERIALGACVPRSSTEIKYWLSEVYNRHPEKKYHLLGITRKEILTQFPLDSVDSTTWIRRFGINGNKNFVSHDRSKEQIFRAKRFLNITANGGWVQGGLF